MLAFARILARLMARPSFDARLKLSGDRFQLAKEFHRAPAETTEAAPGSQDHDAIKMESHHDHISLFKHDLFGKPVSTFPDHALIGFGRLELPRSIASGAANTL